MARILILYSEIFPYMTDKFEEMTAESHDILIFSWGRKRALTMFTYEGNLDIHYDYSHNSNMREVIDFKPDLVYVSGWMDIEYLKLCRYLRCSSENIKIVVGFDDIWFGTIKQRLASILGSLGVFKIFFTHAWVSGYPQYEYAKRLNFTKIIFGLLSPAKDFYTYQPKIKRLQSKLKLLYVGRLSMEKGVKAMSKLCSHPEIKDLIELHIVGDGPCKDALEHSNVIHHGYQDSSYILKLTDSCHFGILLSDFEQWGVALHEYCLLGMPVIITEAVGARENLCIHKKSGFVLNNNLSNLNDCVFWMITEAKREYLKLSQTSRSLGETIPESFGVLNFLSLV